MPTIYDIQREDIYAADTHSNVTYDARGSIKTAVDYTSAIVPRQIILTRSTKRFNNYNHPIMSKPAVSSTNAVPLRGVLGTSKWTLVPFNSQQTQEKRQLIELNDRFAEYVGRVRYLEAINRKLSRDLDNVRNKKGIGLQRIQEIIVREKAEAEETLKSMSDDIHYSQHRHHEASTCLKEAEQRLAHMQRPEQMNNAKIQLQQLRETIFHLEKHTTLIGQTIVDNEDEITFYYAELERIRSDVVTLTSEISNEATQKQILISEKTVLEQELKALDIAHRFDIEQIRSKTVLANIDSTPFFESELTSAIHDIRQQFQAITDQQQQQLQHYYEAKVRTLIECHQPKQTHVSQWQLDKVREITRCISDVRIRIHNLQLENQHLDRQIADIQQQSHIKAYQDDQLLMDEQKRFRDDIDHLKGYINHLEKYRTTLKEEIHRYRQLLEGGTNQIGLQYFAEEAEKIMHRGRSLLDSFITIPSKPISGLIDCENKCPIFYMSDANLNFRALFAATADSFYQ